MAADAPTATLPLHLVPSDKSRRCWSTACQGNSSIFGSLKLPVTQFNKQLNIKDFVMRRERRNGLFLVFYSVFHTHLAAPPVRALSAELPELASV